MNPPEDLAGYQHIINGFVQDGDIMVEKLTRRKFWAGSTIGNQIPLFTCDVYRKMECPRHEGQTLHSMTSKMINEEVDRAYERINNDGELVKMKTGSLRENKKGKGRFDLIPYEPTRQLAVHFEDGGVKHGDRNWELGQPLSTYLNSGKRHAAQTGSMKDENHAISACWNFFCLIQTAKWIQDGKLPKELDDIGWNSKE